jgi:predicted amidohydrolase YtcJ
MWTRDAAQVLQWEGVGTLGPGAHADLIVVDRDPLTCAVGDLPATRVLRTVLGGATVFDAGAL